MSGSQHNQYMEIDFHIGHIIRDELYRQKRTVTWFADNINCDRTTCYDIFNRKFVNCEQLEKISIALSRNFFLDFSDYEESVVKNHTQV